jgi:Flp pilus assembly protein TadG
MGMVMGSWAEVVLPRIVRTAFHFALSRRGNVAIMTALVAPALVGFCAFGAETGYWYYRQRSIQAAADIGAFNATMSLRSGASSSTVTTVATTDSASNGWVQPRGTITVHTPPTSGSNQNTRSVEVILTENETRFFTALFSSTPVTVRSRAVGTYNLQQNACMLGLDPSLPNDVQFWGNADANFTGCNIVSDSNASNAFAVGGSARVTVPCVDTVGGDSVSAGLTLTSCSQVTNHAPPVADPYAGVPTPAVTGACAGGPSGGSLSPGRFCGGLTLQNTVALQPGVYVIDGGTLKMNANAVLTGSGVTFFLTNGATVQMNGGAQVTLSAPTTGSYKGLVFYGDRSQPSAVNKINGNSSSTITGAIYFPSQEVDFLGNFSGSNGCTQVVADKIYYTGSATFQTNCTGTGMASINVPGNVVLAE